MPNPEEALLLALELHSPERLRALLEAGLDPRAPVRGKSPVQWLLEMYTRSDRFPACLRLLLDRGAELADPALAPVLLDDAEALAAAIRASRALLGHRITLVSAFTPLVGASLLHVAAEYGHLNAAQILIELGADVDARAAVDEDGLGEQTPLFHTVNSNENRSAPILRLLLEAGASPDLRIDGLTWGRGFEWETTFFDLTPISYAQLGLLPQMHRDERQITDNVALLLAAAGRAVPAFGNVPNRYLRPELPGLEGSTEADPSQEES
ncbi:MAG TPA: ankyrin repeat domain-containing protein [Thermoanaerobaculia bacterium]|nr:ankyrin repeat domain-containing protein [Thermoanaerobaculia bacterium]